MRVLHERGSTPNSIRRYFAVLSAALSEAQRWQWIPTNVAKLATKPAVAPPEHRALTKDEVRALIAAADAADPTNGTFMRLLVISAARLGEAAALHWEDVEFEGARLHIGRSPCRAAGTRREGPPKGRFAASIPLSRDALALLRSWHEEATASGRGTPEAYVVSRFSDGSRPINAKTYSQFQGRLARRLGVDLGGRNPFRHVSASWIQVEAIAPGTAARTLRHADPGVTLTTCT